MSEAVASPEKESTTNGLDELLATVSRNNPNADKDLILKAYAFSKEKHKDQKRRSGEPFLNHPLEVARILADFGLDTVTVATGLLHDTVEDTVATLEEIQRSSGPRSPLSSRD